jgi:DNA-binding transcriptional LysR family regulator
VQRFTERYPGVELSLTVCIPEQLLALLERRLHVGFVHPPVDNPDLTTQTVLIEPLVVALPARQLAGETRIELGAL